MNLTIELHPASEPPDADLDCLIWDGTEPEAQLGAYVGDGWVNAQGEAVEGVHTWAHLPCLPVLAVGEARELGTVPAPQVTVRAGCPVCLATTPCQHTHPLTGAAQIPVLGPVVVDLNGPWSLPR